MARRLKTLAKLINETMPEYQAEVCADRLNNDGKVGRLRIPRKGIPGNRITVYVRGTFRRVFTYHTGEWPTTNEYVERWIRDTKAKQ